MTWVAAAVISGGASIVGGYLSGEAAKDAANTQAAAARDAQAQQKQMFDIQSAQQAAGRGAGYQSLNQLRSMLPGSYTQYDESGKAIGGGTGDDYLTHRFNAQDFQADPGYAFILQQGQLANQAAANRAGGLIGGNALAGLQDYTQGAASTQYGNVFNRYQAERTGIYNTLAGIAGLGQTAQSQANQLGQNYANNVTGLITGAGAAQAAGQIGQANAISGGLQGAGSSYMLSQLMRQQPGSTAPTTSTPGYSDYFRTMPPDPNINITPA